MGSRAGRCLVNDGGGASVHADFVHDPGAAPHEDLWPGPRATSDGLGRAARTGGEEPARHAKGADHRRIPVELDRDGNHP